MVRRISIVHLYSREMNIYGDTGNVLVLKKRLEWRDIRVSVSSVGIGDTFPSQCDIIVGGGGQDAGQMAIQKDLLSKQAVLRDMAEDGIVMLMICGLYQLFGHRFIISETLDLEGIGVLDVETKAGSNRLIGNIEIDTQFGMVVGYENHSGQTFLNGGAEPFGHVVRGEGNNEHDETEGCVRQNIIGTYLHGPILPKNPALADSIIERALKRKYDNAEVSLKALDDSLAHEAVKVARARPR